MIEIGNKVVCIRDGWDIRGYNVVNPPIKNQTYVVIGMWVYKDSMLGLLLIGSHSYHKITGRDCGFIATNFRKLEDVKMENELKALKSSIGTT